MLPPVLVVVALIPGWISCQVDSNYRTGHSNDISFDNASRNLDVHDVDHGDDETEGRIIRVPTAVEVREFLRERRPGKKLPRADDEFAALSRELTDDNLFCIYYEIKMRGGLVARRGSFKGSDKIESPRARARSGGPVFRGRPLHSYRFLWGLSESLLPPGGTLVQKQDELSDKLSGSVTWLCFRSTSRDELPVSKCFIDKKIIKNVD